MVRSAQLIKEFESTSKYEQACKAAETLDRVFKDALKINDEELVIIGDSGVGPNHNISTMLSYSYYQSALNHGFKPNFILQEPKDRIKEVSPEVLNILKTLPKKSSLMVVASNRFGTLDGLGKSFRSYCSANKHRFTSASSLGQLSSNHFETVVDSLRINYKQMAKKQEKIKQKLDVANEIHITTPAGTDLFLGSKNCKAVYNHGIYDTYGTGGNLPAGEIYIPVAKRDAYGKLVIDGSSRQKNKTVLCEEPINLYFENGEVRKITGGTEAEGLEKTYAWANRRAKFPWGIKMACELGIGLNEKAKIIGATIIDEKVKGTAHIATGSNHWFGGDIFAIVHLDQVFKNPSIKLDGKRLNI